MAVKLLIFDDAGFIDDADTISPGEALEPITSSATSAGVPPVVSDPAKIGYHMDLVKIYQRNSRYHHLYLMLW